MRFDKVIYLLSSSNSENDIGDTINTPKRRKMYARKKSVRQSEFYQAASTGLKPEITFVIWNFGYEGESELEFEGKKYRIIRTFEKDDKELELICTGLVGGK